MDHLDILAGTIFSPIPECHILTVHIPSLFAQIFPDRPELGTCSGKKREIFCENDFSAPILSSKELDRLNEFKVLKKQAEWLSGRYTVKKLFQSVISPETSFPEIVLDHEDQGAPFLVSHAHIPVSISHSHEYAASVLCTNPSISLGMDLERINKKPDDHFLKIAFTPQEIFCMDTSAQGIFQQWTIKEAYLKLIKKGFHEGLRQVEIIHEKIFRNGLEQDVRIWSQKIHQQYAISIVWGKKNFQEKKQRI